MKRIEIRTPIWKTRSIGINTRYKMYPCILVDITYVKVDGKRLYPETFKIDSEQLKMYPIQTVKKVDLYIVPIADLKLYDLGDTFL